MTAIEIEPQIRRIVSDTFDIALSTLGADPSNQTIGAWDSFAQLSLVLSVEEAFQIKLRDEQVFSATSVSKITSFVEEALRKN